MELQGKQNTDLEALPAPPPPDRIAFETSWLLLSPFIFQQNIMSATELIGELRSRKCQQCAYSLPDHKASQQQNWNQQRNNNSKIPLFGLYTLVINLQREAILGFMQQWAVPAPACLYQTNVQYMSRVYLGPQGAPEILVCALENPRIELPELILSLAPGEGKQEEYQLLPFPRRKKTGYLKKKERNKIFWYLELNVLLATDQYILNSAWG